MAWTDACKIEAVAQIDHKVEQGMSVRKALKELAKESGIPAKTIERWKYPQKSVLKNEDTKEPKPFDANQIATKIINKLASIKIDDPRREEALTRVKRWITENL